MADIALAFHALLCLGAIILTVALRRDTLRLRTLGPRGEGEDLAAFRRTFRGLRWKLPLLFGLVVGALILGAQWATVWRGALPGQAVLNTLCVLAGINVVVASGETHRQQWSARGSVAGLLRAMLWAAVAIGLFGLTLYWRFGG